MPAFDALMKRLGYVRLSSYGLVLTPEGRVLSLRPAVLDDGLGGKIVGWRDGDLAAMELDKWEPARPASQAAVANRLAAGTPPPQVRPAVASAPIAAPITAPAPAPVAIAREHAQQMAVPVKPVTPVPVANVAPAPVVEEDDDEWEWTIAVARARAAAEEAEVAAAPLRPTRRLRANTVPPPVEAPARVPAAARAMAKVAAVRPDPIAEDTWPKTEPLTTIDYKPYTSPSVEVVTPAPAPRAKTSPPTVIPIPKLPSIPNVRIEPVVKTALPTPMPPVPPRRFAKGTGPVLPKVSTALPVPAPSPASANSDDTVPNIQLPPAAAARALPSIKRLSRG